MTPWTVASLAPPSMGFSRQECWSGLPFPSPEDLPDSGMESRFPVLQEDSLQSEPPGKGKARGGDGIPAELFQILKDNAVKVLNSICYQIWKTHQWPHDWKILVFFPIPKKGSVKECSNYGTIAPISHASKVMLKILQVRFQQYMNWELPEITLIIFFAAFAAKDGEALYSQQK